ILEAELRQQIQLAKGDWLNVDQLRKGITRMVQMFGARGFKDATVVPVFSIDRTNHSVSATFTVHQTRANSQKESQSSPGDTDAHRTAAQNPPPAEPADPRNLNPQSNNSGQTYRAGENGVTMPKCVYCPKPEYSPEARTAKLMGTVYLQVTVLANGHPGEIKLIQGIGSGLDEKAIVTVRNQWTFSPANGPDGTPVDATVPVEI